MSRPPVSESPGIRSSNAAENIVTVAEAPPESPAGPKASGGGTVARLGDMELGLASTAETPEMPGSGLTSTAEQEAGDTKLGLSPNAEVEAFEGLEATGEDEVVDLGDVKLGLSSTFVASSTAPTPGAPAPGAHALPTRWTFRYGPAFQRPFSAATRTLILVLATFSSLMGPFAATMYAPALPQIEEELGTTAALVNLTLTLGALVTGVAPMMWAPFSDLYGRRPVLILSTILNIAANVATFWVPNVGWLLAMRLFATAGSSAGISVGSGCVADVYPPVQRGRALGILFLGAIIGPIVSPPIGGLIASTLGWRWIFLVVAFIGAAFLVPVVLFLPETLPSVTAPRTERKRRPNPFSTLPFLRYPFVLAVVCDGVASIIAAFSIPATLPRIYATKYGLSPAGNGLVLMSTGVGSILGSLVGGQLTDRGFKWFKALRGLPVAEDRLRSSYLGLLAVPSGLLIYGMCTQFSPSIAGGVVGLAVQGFGSMLVSTSTNSYLLDIFSLQAASIIALLNFIRYLFACWIPVVAAPAEEAMGTGGFYAMFAGINLVASCGLLWTVVRGTASRARVEPWRSRDDMPAQLEALGRTGSGVLVGLGQHGGKEVEKIAEEAGKPA
ncbi:major facilitator superfamily domain-containing protein [Hyaloraphidium curvatum]|nr:major facilitator superfamily domain-containing protein [Hyaloraphidium curvatum]